MIYDVFLALGSNLGERDENLSVAAMKISALEHTSLTGKSDIYETEPVGYTSQGRFLNMAVKIQTSLEPLQLLLKLQEIELQMGRVRTIRFGPRIIDIDILLYGDLKVDLPELTIPHVRMYERAFVLVPLRDLLPAVQLNGFEIDELIDRTADRDGVKLFKKAKGVHV